VVGCEILRTPVTTDDTVGVGEAVTRDAVGVGDVATRVGVAVNVAVGTFNGVAVAATVAVIEGVPES
jgi:hypothetical protein